MIYTSKQNDKIKYVASLKQKKYRLEYQKYIVEGVKMVNEAIKYNAQIESIFLSESFKGELFKTNAEIKVVSDSVFEYLTDLECPQGVLAVLNIPKNGNKQLIGSCILLDGVRDPGNLGTIIRTAVASGYKDILLVDCCDAYNPKVIRSSMSGIYFVNLINLSREEVLDKLNGTPIIVADMNGENVYKFKSPKNYCLVIGNEANGVSNYVKSVANFTVKIPMDERMESLNAGVSAAILMYQLKNS